MYNIIDQELLDWVSNNGLPVGKPGAGNNFSQNIFGTVNGN